MARQYKLARQRKGVTITKAAADLGVSQPTLSSWESERKNPSIDNLINMSSYYNVSVDFLLGLTTQEDKRLDTAVPVSADMLPALHQTPVYDSDRGWAFVDAIKQTLQFADGSVKNISDLNSKLYMLPPDFSRPGIPNGKPIVLYELPSLRDQKIWIEPISADTSLRSELRGWYTVHDRYAENEAGQRFYFDFYGSKWFAFTH